MAVSAAMVRDILGELGGELTDEQITSTVLAASVNAEIAALCPTWAAITGDDLAALEAATAYLTAVRLAGNAGATGGEVRSMSHGDQSITFASGYVADTAKGWRDDAMRLLGAVCPVTIKPLSGAVIFTMARGRRG